MNSAIELNGVGWRAGKSFELKDISLNVPVGSIYGSSVARHMVPRLIELYMAGKLNLDDLLTRSYPLDRINEAYDAIAKERGL